MINPTTAVRSKSTMRVVILLGISKWGEFLFRISSIGIGKTNLRSGPLGSLAIELAIERGEVDTLSIKKKSAKSD